uniref:Uncharacterized protein n=1 Tax=Astyanax mexicanus TaxID=7994 RepID=A0A3B1K0T7_ASTMX
NLPKSSRPTKITPKGSLCSTSVLRSSFKRVVLTVWGQGQGRLPQQMVLADISRVCDGLPTSTSRRRLTRHERFAPGTKPGQTERVAPGTKPGQTERVAPGTKPGQTERVAPGTKPGQTEQVTPGTKPGQTEQVTPGTKPGQTEQVHSRH